MRYMPWVIAIAIYLLTVLVSSICIRLDYNYSKAKSAVLGMLWLPKLLILSPYKIFRKLHTAHEETRELAHVTKNYYPPPAHGSLFYDYSNSRTKQRLGKSDEEVIGTYEDYSGPRPTEAAVREVLAGVERGTNKVWDK